MTHIETLINLDACRDAILWATNYPDAQSAWDACERGDWMLWLIGKTVAGEPWSDDRRRLVAACAECAALAPECSDPGIELARQWAIDASMRWAYYEADQDEVMAAYAAAYSAAYSAGYSAAYSASYAAAYSAAYSASYSATYSATYSAAYAADAAAYSADAVYKENVLRECADIVRRYYPKCPI